MKFLEEMKNSGSFKKILAYVLITVLALYGLGATAGWISSSVRYHRTDGELGRCRTELADLRGKLEHASNQQRLVDRSLGECQILVGDSEAVLSRTATTLGELRGQLSILRKNYEAMERIIADARSYNGGNDDDTDNTAM